MSRRWLLSLLCLSVCVALLAPLTRARGELKVDEASTRFLIEKEPAEALLAVENSSGESQNVKVEIKILDPMDVVISQASDVQTIKAGAQTIKLNFSELKVRDRHDLLWLRLQYRLSSENQSVVSEGIISLSQIMPDLFELRVSAGEFAREGGHYKARVLASHPVTHKPAANVVIDGELKLEDESENGIKLHNSRTTDAEGYAVLDFVMPKQFPVYPHKTQPSGGQLHVIGKRGAVTAEAEGNALVDQFTKTLITTDKPLYQPGQIMHLRALIFTPSKRALANQNILFKVADPEGTVVHRVAVKSSRFGIASTDWSIPDNVRLGDYRIHVAVEGNNDEWEEASETMYDVRISRYDLPNFTVNVRSDREYYLPGQNAEVRVRADYLFGQPVKRGHVRVVRETEREWNYREQKWDVDEGDEQKGETDANGVFVARLDLSSEQEELAERDYDRFEDLTFAAYFTDPTTNRTEQRRFDLRLTREPIHVYVISDRYQNRSLPLRFYVTTSYADGTPARCKVNVRVSNESYESRVNRRKIINSELVTVRTNRYGVAKISGVGLPRELEKENAVELRFAATDSNGRIGKQNEDVYLDDDDETHVETSKTIYRAGEPITATVTSSGPDEPVIVDVLRDNNVIYSERMRLENGRGTTTIPYKPDFKDMLVIAAYPDFPSSKRDIQGRTILYPLNDELQIKARTSQTTYRPGENAHVTLNVLGPAGGGAESALGVTVSDKAVTERYRTMQEFGRGGYGSNNSLARFLDLDVGFAGVTLRDLQRLKPSTVIAPDLDLVAEVMLNQGRSYSLNFFGGDDYNTTAIEVFESLMENQLKPAKEILTNRYFSKKQYPGDEALLRSMLLEGKINLDQLRDPWGIAYKPVFTVEGPHDVLTFNSAGPDKRFDTDDDFIVDRTSWPYFVTLGATFDQSVREYHERTGGYIRDVATLRDELSRAGLSLDQLRDRWGEPYRISFDVNQSNFVLTVSSGGPDKQFADDKYKGDDFDIWRSAIDYFAESRTQIEQILNKHLTSTKSFPQTGAELREALTNSENSLDTLRDPWGHSYYATFNTQTLYTDRAQVENRAKVGDTPTTRVTVTPVTQKVTIITLRSMGADGTDGTADDFTVASFRGVISEQTQSLAPQPQISPVVLSAANGVIRGKITDPNGASVPGVKVTAIQSWQPKGFEGLSDEEGNYTISGLPPGMYEVQFAGTGFTKLVYSDVTVPVIGVVEINAVLQPGTVTETVSITAGNESLLTQASETLVGRSVTDRQFRIVTKSGGSMITTPHLREYFPETLVWQPSIETDKQGRARIDFKLADNITTWKLAVVGSTEDGRIGTTETEIKSFQPFFVEHDPPRVLTEGDEISLPVVVRNYLRQPQNVDLELKSERWFSLLGPGQKRATVAAGDASRETFRLRAVSSIKDGKQRIIANAADGNDAIDKPVTVHPDGEELSSTDSDVLGSSATLQLNLPENMIPNSGEAEVKIYPNLMAHVIESVEAIMSRPNGCGEQTISSTYPSLLLLRNRKVSGEDSPLTARAHRYLSLGYSRLLNYRDESGGFTYWGRGTPDLALTAYALRFLNDARELIAVDPDVINEAQEWLIKQQQSDGSWQQVAGNDGYTSRRNTIVTAYIARILATTHTDSDGKAAALKESLDYLSGRVLKIDEPYLLASYALAALGNRDIARATPIIEKLGTLAHREGTTVYWSLEADTPFYGWGLAGQVETTALVVHTLSQYCLSQTAKCESDPKLVSGGLLFLLKQKDRYGVWYSTQATINVLDAMLSMLSLQGQTDSASEADIFVNDQLAQTIAMPATNGLVNPITIDISKFLKKGNNVIRIRRAEGSHYASVQALASYYGPWPAASNKTETRGKDLRLQARCDKTEGKVGDEITCHVEAERIGFQGYGMMLAEIGVPPGADVDRASLETAMKGSGSVINQYDVLPDRIVLYLWPQAGGVKFDFKFRPRFGLNAKAAASVLYDYYNPEARTVVPPATFRVKE